MATAAQITANQLNAQSSTGPSSATGKETVSRNAVKHNLAAKKFFLAESDKAVFDELRESLSAYYGPATDHERALVEELSELKWRCRTARSMEASFFELMVKEQRKADPTLTHDQALARVFIDETLQKRMRLMMRYVTSAERSAEKIRKELEEVLAVRYACEKRQRERDAHAHAVQRRAAEAAALQQQATNPPVQNKANFPQLR